ncbi:MAG: TonB-dependent receptor plug domain-containing protein, partial [Bacteroidales bacterium]|nr:TonB-dependent receptor plug domain-containing protein [Bacteroidales bacterium]
MRLCLFFMLVLQIGVSASGYTQQRVSLSMQDVTLEHVLKELKKQTGLRFFYSVEKVRSEQKKVINIENDVLENALRSVLMGTGLTFTIMNDVVVIKDEVVSTADSLQKGQQLLKGIVKDKAGEPLPGVTILIEGTIIGCATDIDGKYSLTLPGEVKGVVLVFRFVGMETKKVSMDEVKDKEILQGKKELVVVLEEQTENLDDVVVTGIFRRSKELATGASVTVTGEQLKMVGNQNILQSLRTLDPSFKIVENNLNGSDPNALPEIEVRGANGIPDLDANYKGNPNQPLFILDGFEVSLQRVVDLDPNRVESISILKDASAAALYGSRSANGVIVIETKAPEIGRLRLSYNGDYAVVMPDLTDYDLLNAREALELQKDAGHFEGRSLSNDIEMKEYYNRMLKNVMEGVDTYWLSKPLRTAFEHRHNFELSGGDKVIRYGINFSVRMTPGVMKGSSHNNYMGGVFLQYRKGGLLFKNDLQITANESKNSPYGEFSQYVSLNPYVRPYDEQGRPVKLFDDKYPDFLEGSQFNKNPLYNATFHSVDEEKYTDFTNNFSIEWTISENLTLMGRFSLTKQFNSSDLFYSASHTMFEELGDPINSPDEFLRRGKASFSNGESFSILGDLNLRYGQSFGKHNIYAVVGLNASQSKNHDKTVDVEGFPNDNMS